MNGDIQVEPLGDHEYLVRFLTGGEAVVTRFHATETTVARLGVPGAGEERIVAETAGFLVERQREPDLPPMVDLYDVAAAYGDLYLAELGQRLT